MRYGGILISSVTLAYSIVALAFLYGPGLSFHKGYIFPLFVTPLIVALWRWRHRCAIRPARRGSRPRSCR
jgi:hypothetical protein